MTESAKSSESTQYVDARVTSLVETGAACPRWVGRRFTRKARCDEPLWNVVLEGSSRWFCWRHGFMHPESDNMDRVRGDP